MITNKTEVLIFFSEFIPVSLYVL